MDGCPFILLFIQSFSESFFTNAHGQTHACPAAHMSVRQGRAGGTAGDWKKNARRQTQRTTGRR